MKTFGSTTFLVSSPTWASSQPFSSIFSVHVHGGPRHPDHGLHSTLAPSGKQRSRELRSRLPAPPGHPAASLWLTWSQRAICLVFHLETPVVRSRFMLPRNTTRFTLWFLQFASWVGTETIGEPGPSTRGSVESRMGWQFPQETRGIRKQGSCIIQSSSRNREGLG